MIRARSIAPVLSGILLTLSFPPLCWYYLAWIAFIPLFWAVDGVSLKDSFKIGLIAGFSHYLTLLYWITIAIGRYGNMGLFVQLLSLFLLCIYLSLYFGMFCYLFRLSYDRWFSVILVPSFWTLLEFLRARLLSGFPWCLLGYSQFEFKTLIQVADITGVYGISLLVMMGNTVLYNIFFVIREGYIKGLLLNLTIFTTLLLLVLVYGNYRLRCFKNPEGGCSFKVSIIQGNVDQSIKWNPAYQKQTIQKYIRLTYLTKRFRPDLIVWPETALPFFFQEDSPFSKKIRELSKEMKAYILFGSPAYGRGHPRRFYNRAYLLSPSGKEVSYYDKVHLVPFGEYLPFKGVFSFLRGLLPNFGEFESGSSLAPLRFKDISMGILICFESIFPELSSEEVRRGAGVLVNITNDAWFGNSSAPYQHFQMGAFRAVENRVYLIRCANTGISGIVDPAGRVIAESNLFKEEVINLQIHIYNHLSFYTRHPTTLIYFILIICIIGLSYIGVEKKREKGGRVYV